MFHKSLVSHLDLSVGYFSLFLGVWTYKIRVRKPHCYLGGINRGHTFHVSLMTLLSILGKIPSKILSEENFSTITANFPKEYPISRMRQIQGRSESDCKCDYENVSFLIQIKPWYTDHHSAARAVANESVPVLSGAIA